MGRQPSASACERARAWAALRPDGELSTIEVRLLDVHLDGCSACRQFAETVNGATRLVRETEDEAPSCSFDVRLARRSRFRSRAASGARASVVAAAVIAAFSLGVVLPDLPRSGGTSSSAPHLKPVLSSGPSDGELLRIERAGDPRTHLRAVGRRYGAIL